MKKSKLRTKVLFYFVIIASFGMIYFYNVFTPIMSDDLLYDGSIHSVKDAFSITYKTYMEWNGRFVGQFVMNCFLALPKVIFNVMNSLCFVLLGLGVYFNIEKRKKYDWVLLSLIMFMIWQFGVSFDQTILWMAGACNYLWTTTIMVGFMALYRNMAQKETRKYAKNKIARVCSQIFISFGFFVFGILAGWGNENTSGGAFLIVGFTLIELIIKKKRINCYLYAGIIGQIIGLLGLVLSPGNKARSSIMGTDSHTGVMKYIARFLKINIAIEKYLLVLMGITIILLAYDIIRKYSFGTISSSIVFLVSSLATCFALILTAPPMDRAYFGAGIFMIIACVQAIALIPKEDHYLCALKYGSIIVFGIMIYFTYLSNAANLMRLDREIKQREELVLEAIANGQSEVIVPMLSPQYETRFSYLYENDVCENPEDWGSYIYERYYGIDSIIGMPRADWLEMMGMEPEWEYE